MKYLKIKIALIFLLGMTLSQLKANENVVTCDAYFTYEVYDGPIPGAGGITFFNQSIGDYTEVSWDFGDGGFSNDSSAFVDYFYAIDGVYNVCMTVWNDQECQETFCTDVIVGSLSDICNLTDCVFPGDANKDGEANFYDLLDLGIGNGLTGIQRPNATIEWVGQLAPDWAQETIEGVNYKHLDCDGNGIIDNDDALAITLNYTPMNAPNPTTETSAPLIHIDFDQDTIYINPDTLSANIQVTAHLKIGNQVLPAENIYGLALYLGYSSDLVFEDSISVAYNDNSFFGSSDEVFWLPNNQYAEEQMDLGITRVDGNSVDGFGKIGEVVYIINSDIIDGRIDDGDAHFIVSVNGVKMIDSTGNILDINLENTPSTLVFTKVDNEPTATNSIELGQEIDLFPNPATDRVLISIPDLIGEYLEVFNNFGQTLFEQNINDTQIELNTRDWNPGIYFVKIKTTEGVVSKRFVLN
ncbi:MAG: T9SS type A sorting domain-containing protein [Saprospiraceae bacterium]|nr:T9SS type A sorting domain-containing protein [Saprospiraceae bacterium]MDB4768835.1 T9SS type A sorting domain-containing protein [Saprospiraceae bacterium]MDG1434987.1 T9SS type A sorting domain-containing protein [Saprospiraceae bacterium]MDG2418805.1 T9SS type A sorting domain-containing protein [Saprospiraceae bacterium]